MASLISINSHGLRMDDRRQTAFLFFKRHKFDIVFIQETHWTDEQKSAIEQDWDGDIYFNPGTRNACGVAILINSHLDYQLHHRKQDSHGRVLALEISFEDTTINLVNIYAPRSDLERRSFFTQLETFLSDQFENILGGDFNCIADLRLDKLGGNPDARQSANTSLLNIMSRYSLFDIWRERNKSTRNYTWSGKNPQDNSIIRSRIDKFLISRNLSPKAVKSAILPYPHSDHDLVSLTLDLTQQQRGPGLWHFNNSLLSDPVFAAEIRSFWESWLAEKETLPNPLLWWDKAKHSFKQIAIRRATILRKIERHERHQLESNLQFLQQKASNGSPADIEKYLLTKEKLKQFEINELEAVKLRAKARFTEEGEKSTRYFYSLEKRQQANHSIRTLTKDNLDTITDPYDLISETYRFYKSLYSAEATDDNAQHQIFTSYPIPTLPLAERDSCDAPLTEHELQQALSTMENNKSPGIDGLSTNFYKFFWPLFGSQLTAVFNYAFQHGSLSVTQRRGVITLVFKKGDRTKLKNWRPITLLTTDYKILTKALANRLKSVLHLLIHPDQTACIPNRTINDNVSLLRDAIHYANESNTPLALISIDQLKAFDRVSHSFLLATLARFGFGPTFIQWISTIYTAVTSSVKVNGWLTAFINLDRGLRQGCALSMPLYILTAEILAIQIRANPLIKGIRPPQTTSEVKLSQYADDTSLLLRDVTSISHTFETLALYERASGAKINREKCKGLWAGSLRHRSDSIYDFAWFNDYIPDKILGHIFGNVDCTRYNLEPRIQKLKNTIEAWRHRELSFKGKALIINGLLTSTLWYTATSSPVPQWAISDIEQAIYSFFWDNKHPLVNRETLALPTSEGGHNIHRVAPKIEALRINTLRRLLHPDPAPWKFFAEHFLRVSNMRLGRLTLATSFLSQHIDTTIPLYHQELLRAWSKHHSHHTRIHPPSSLADILHEPLFRSMLIQHNGHPIYYKHWISAGLTQVKDLCYIVIPGLLPAMAIHELLAHGGIFQPFQRTARELQELLHAFPPPWLPTISSSVCSPSPATNQPTFSIPNTMPGQPPLDLCQGSTRTFYLHLMSSRAPELPALQHWHSTLLPRPTFGRHRWKLAYPPLVTNKLGDLNWKIIHRVLPTAQSLYRMTVHPTPNCHLCGFPETLEHLLLHCTHITSFWLTIHQYVDKLTNCSVPLTNTTKLFGYLRQDDPLDQATINLLNWLLTIARYSIHRSAVEARLRQSMIPPSTYFSASVKSHLTQQYRLYKLRQTQYLFPYIWCIREALAKVSDDKLVFTL